MDERPAEALPPRFLNWEASLNTRDLGGLPSRSGGLTHRQTLVRSENSALLTPAGLQAALDYGIRTVIDLRFPLELERSPSPFAALDAAQLDYRNISLETDQDLIWPGEGTPAEAMGDLYCRLLESNRGYVAATLAAIAHARPGGVLFHCHAGKDRTGLIAALALAVADVPDELIIEDYAVTHPRLEQRRREFVSDPAQPPEKRAYLEVIGGALPGTMRFTLDYLQRSYAGVTGYLRSTAFSAQDQQRLRERVLA